MEYAMSDNAIVPPETAGWMVRVTASTGSKAFFMVALPGKVEAEAAVRDRADATNRSVEGVATLSKNDLAKRKLGPGQIAPA
jgi:hypothetical protein